MPHTPAVPGQPLRALIFAAGVVHDPERLRQRLRPAPGDLVICADGGLVHARRLGLTPDLIIGDFDSLPGGLAEAMSTGAPVKEVPRAKDETDTHLALLAAVQRGVRHLVLAGGIGSRMDHTLANLLLAPGLPTGTTLTLVNEHNVVHVLPPNTGVTLDGSEGGNVSLLPLSPFVHGIHTAGLRWPMAGATLAWGESRGVSNEFTSPQASVRCGEGWLLVLQTWD